MVVEAATDALVARRAATGALLGTDFRTTNFYPIGDGNDRIDRVSAIRSVRFQEVIPRYRLSTNLTRDEGTGPLMMGALAALAPPREEAADRALAAPRSGLAAGASRRAPLPDGAGTRIDLLA